MNRRLVTECFGTFLLGLLVHTSLGSSLPVTTPVIAGLTLALIVYALGPISGAHVNPAVTLGLMSVQKISVREGSLYILSQMIGGLLALLIGNLYLGGPLAMVTSSAPMVGIGEVLGTAVLVLAVSSVVRGHTPSQAAGFVIGTGLTLGALLASAQSNGVLNPAVALAIGGFSLWYVVGPLVGGVAAAWGYKCLCGE